MSYLCEAGHVTTPRTRMVRVVVETRVKQYPEGGVGIETVREVKLCPDHARELALLEAAQPKGTPS